MHPGHLGQQLSMRARRAHEKPDHMLGRLATGAKLPDDLVDLRFYFLIEPAEIVDLLEARKPGHLHKRPGLIDRKRAQKQRGRWLIAISRGEEQLVEHIFV